MVLFIDAQGQATPLPKGREAGTRATCSRAVGWIVALLVVASLGAAPLRAATIGGPEGGDDGWGIASWGVLSSRTGADLARELDDYVRLGVTWVRIDLEWAHIEPRNNTFRWGRFDRLVDAIQKRGMKVIATLAYAPGWARASSHPRSAPREVPYFAQFAQKAVRHFAPRGVKVFEIWNEPNIHDFWKPAPDPAFYASMLQRAYIRMKKADGSIVVLAGAFSPAGSYAQAPQGTINPVRFLEAMYANGAQGHFDGISHHPYTFAASPRGTNPGNAWYQMAWTSPSLRSLMEANGDGAKQIWATEYGSPVSHVGEAGQVQLLHDAFDLWQTYPWAGPLTYYTYRDLEAFSLVRRDWTLRPAWYAFQSRVRPP